MSNDKNETQVYVSVILPSLNVAQYVRDCLKSVLNQTLKEIEILCIDAGSTDGTLEILEEYALTDTRIHVIKSKRKSYGYQMNLGIEKARGRYIGIVETDDFIETSMYEKLYSYVPDSSPDFVKGGYYNCVQVKERRLFSELSRDNLREVFGRRIDLQKEREKGIQDLNHIWSGIYRREFLLEKNIKFHETPGASYQDTSFCLLVGLLADTGVFVEESGYFYRRDNDNSSVKFCSKWRCIIDELEYVVQEMINRGRYTSDIQLLIKKYKPIFYFWNFLRLPEQERKQFLEEIDQELEEYAKNNILYCSLNDGQKNMIEVMKNPEIAKCYFAGQEVLEKKYKKLITLAEKGEKFVLVSAGRYGEHMMLLQEIVGTKYIDVVVDNNREKQGSIWYGYTLINTPEAVRKYKKHWFIVANKKYAEEILNQLIEEGISENRILVFDDILSMDRIINLAGDK